MYSRLGDALDLFPNHITSIVTNGRKLSERAYQIIGKCTSVCVSIMEGDEDIEDNVQWILEDFLDKKGNDRPHNILIKLVGELNQYPFIKYKVKIIRRDLHKPEGSWNYHKKPPVIPESGICYDLLHKPSINWKGHFYICNRFSPDGEGMIGDLNKDSLENIWNGVVRKSYIDSHKVGNRNLPLCEKCEYYGIIAGGES
jgi:radical SAM protein with 4Fe4S-binding SPASM domain